MGTVAIFGAGVMGETLLSGLLRAGRPADELVITERREDRAAELTEKYGVRVLDNAEAAELADTLVLVVKPQDMGGLLAEIRDHVAEGNLVVSLAAGITTTYLESRLPAGPRRSCGSCPTPRPSSTRAWPPSARARTATAAHLRRGRGAARRHRQGRSRCPRSSRTP